MRRSLGSLLIVGALIASGSVSTAQDSARVVASSPRPPRSAAACCAAPTLVTEEAAIAARIEDAMREAQEGHPDLAKKTLLAVVGDQQRAGAYPRRALRHLANVHLMLDDPMGSASTLKTLAREAAKVDDDETEVVALVDASVLYVQVRQPARARDLMPRIRRLLASPRVTDETRRTIAGQLGW